MNNCINNYNIYNRAERAGKEKKASRLSTVAAFLLAVCEAVVELFENVSLRRAARAALAVALAVACYFFVGAVLNGAIGTFRAICVGAGIVSLAVRVFGVRASE